MKFLLTLLLLCYTLAFNIGCAETLPQGNKNVDTSVNFQKFESVSLIDKTLSNSKPVYNVKELTAGFAEPINKDGKLIFTDSFIDGTFEDISYLGKEIAIKNCPDLLRYDIREIKNIVSTGRDILLQRKRSCILIKKLTNGTDILGASSEIIKSDLVASSNIQLEKVIASIPSRVSEDRKMTCSVTEIKNITCKGDQPVEEYSIYINHVVADKDKNYYFVDVYAGRSIYYYLININDGKIYNQWIYY